MALGMLTADWFLLGRDLYFRKFEIYSMEWQLDINMENVVLVAAQYGGPIAVMRDKNKLQKLKGNPQTVINVFSGSGKPLIPIKWNGKRIVKMGWSNEEELICIQEDGKVVIHDVFTGEIRSLSIFQEVQVKDAIIFTNPQNFTGIAIITKGHKVYYINNIQEPTKRQLSDVMRSSSPSTSWVVISTDNAQTEVLLAREKELYRLTTDEMHPSTMLEPDIKSHYTSILEMALSINSRHVVMFTNAGYLWLGSSDLRTIYAEVETGVIYKPKQLVWCGNEAVVAFWEEDHTLLVVGRHGEKMVYSYDCSVYLVPEIDGTRILSSMQHELLQKVPGVVQKIFRINSTDPGSFLLEASKQFQKRSHRADEYISLVKNDLERAVEQCIQAAGYEFEPEVQKMLIRAAQFGKCFVSDIDSDDYVRMCRILRVLNAVRDTRIGIPLTFTELECSTHQVLLDRLVARRQYYLAIQIAKYLKMSDKEGSNRILVHWAKYKVSKRQSLDDDQIAREIAEKLGYNPCISYSEIAKTASDNGRKKLAIKLLDYEPKASEQVKLLVDLAEYEPALVKAIESGDSDLIYDVILKIYATIPLGDCKLLFHKYTVCLVLYVKYCREHDIAALKEILVQEDDFNSQAQHALISSLQEEKTSERETYLAQALEAYKKCRSDLNVSICDEALRLSKFQKTLEEKLKEPFFGKSVHDTCYELLIQKQLKWAEKLKSDFKIPDKRYWWLRIQVMAEQQQWEELDKFSKLKKSPIGYAPFVDVCLQYEKDREANKYLPRVSEELKIKYYVKANKLEEAAQIAFEQRDHQGLLYVQSRCSPQSELSEKINNYVSQLGARK